MIAFELLVDWALGALDEAEAARVDEHVLGCDACAATATFLLELGDAVTALARAGHVRYACTPSLLERIAADALPVRSYVIDPGATVPCSATPDQVYALTHLNADLTGVVRVDAIMSAPDGTTLEVTEDMPFDPSSGAVVFAEMGDVVRRWPTMVIHVRLRARDAAGAERDLGLYRLSHTA